MLPLLVGREQPAELINGEIRRTLNSHGGLVLVAGEAGIGKTALVSRVMGNARDGGAIVVSGTCWDREGAPGYWPWVQVIRDLRRNISAELWSEAAGAAGDGLTFLLGDFTEPPLAGDAADADFRLYDSITTVLVTVARRQPLVVALDDLHWADLSSLRALDFVVRHTWFERVLVIGTYRDVEMAAGSRERAEHLGEIELKATTVTLTGLDQDTVRRLIVQTTGQEPSDDAVATIHRRTGGNPLFVEQMARLWRSDGSADALPPGVRAAVEHRLGLLPEPVRDLLGHAAVLGPVFNRRTLASVSGVPAPEVNEILDHAASVRLVLPMPTGTFHFAHELVREVIYGEIEVEERRRRHARALDVLGDSPDGRIEPARLAHHAYLAVPDVTPEQAFRRLLEAAREAACRLASEEACGHYERALELIPESQPRRWATIALAHGEQLQRSGRLAAARHIFDDVVRIARTSDDATLLGRAALGIHLLGTEEASVDTELQLLDEAHARLTAESPGTHTGLAARLLAASTQLRGLQGGHDTLVARQSAEAVELARESEDPEALGFCLLARHDALWRPGTGEERLRLAEEITEAARRSSHRELESQGTLLRMVALAELGDPRAADALAALVALADRTRLPRLRYVARSRQAAVALWRGDFRDARSLIDETHAIGSQLEETDRDILRRDQLWALGLLQGTVEDALDAVDAYPVPDDPFMAVLRAGFAVRRGDITAAEHRIPDILALADSAPRWFTPLWSTVYAEIAAASGAIDHCERARETLEPLAGLWAVVYGGGVILGPFRYYLGLLDRALGRLNAAVEQLRTAASDAEALGARPWVVLARFALAAALGERAAPYDADDAGRVLDQARREASALHMRDIPGSDVELPTELREAAQLPTADKPGETFRFDGAVWTLSFDGRTEHLPDAKGLHDLHTLLSRPGVDVPAVELLTAGGDDEVQTARRYSGDAVLDETAKAQYRRRLTELDTEIELAMSRHDDDHAAELDEERAALLAELRRAAGFGGRDRRLGDEAERSRKTVSSRIRDTLKRLDERHPALAMHLRASVTTGIACRYAPLEPVNWQL